METTPGGRCGVRSSLPPHPARAGAYSGGGGLGEGWRGLLGEDRPVPAWNAVPSRPPVWPGEARSISCVRRVPRLRVCVEGLSWKPGRGSYQRSLRGRWVSPVGAARCRGFLGDTSSRKPPHKPGVSSGAPARLKGGGNGRLGPGVRSSPPPLPALHHPPATPFPASEAAPKCHLTIPPPSRTPGLGIAAPGLLRHLASRPHPTSWPGPSKPHLAPHL